MEAEDVFLKEMTNQWSDWLTCEDVTWIDEFCELHHIPDWCLDEKSAHAIRLGVSSHDDFCGLETARQGYALIVTNLIPGLCGHPAGQIDWAILLMAGVQLISPSSATWFCTMLFFQEDFLNLGEASILISELLWIKLIYVASDTLLEGAMLLLSPSALLGWISFKWVSLLLWS